MTEVKVTSAQIRAGRALLGLDQDEVAKAAKVTRKTLAVLENGTGRTFASTHAKVVTALEQLGVRFVDMDAGQGVLLTPSPRDE